MYGKHIQQRATLLMTAAAVFTGGLLLLAPAPASADYESTQGETQTLRTPLIPGALWTRQMQAPMPDIPPPIGSGNNYKPEIQGDTGNPLPPATGQADPTTGNFFGNRPAPGPKPPDEYVPNAGRHQTIKGQQEGVFDQGQEDKGTKWTNNGGPGNGATDVENNGGPRADAAGKTDTLFVHDVQPSRYEFDGPLPTVRVFCHYLVILGVVAATIWVAMASIGMVMGNRGAGDRVIGAAGGLLLLLGGYTIWKIVQMNTFHANSTGWESHYRNGTPQPLQQKNGPPVQNDNPNANQVGNNPFTGAAAPGP
ncbi:MAG TPA: hypothetical protein V6D22_10910 [Candidatus Obscuribacterales bacterium]